MTVPQPQAATECHCEQTDPASVFRLLVKVNFKFKLLSWKPVPGPGQCHNCKLVLYHEVYNIVKHDKYCEVWWNPRYAGVIVFHVFHRISQYLQTSWIISSISQYFTKIYSEIFYVNIFDGNTIFHIMCINLFGLNVLCSFTWFVWLCFTIYHMMFTIEFYQNICVLFCEFFSNISHYFASYFQKYFQKYFTNYDVKYFPDISQSWYFTKCCTQISDISRHLFISPPWFHSFVRTLFRTAIVRRFLAAFLPMSALASSSGQFLGSLHSAQLLRRGDTGVPSFQSLNSMFDHCISTLVLCSTSREKPRYNALLALFSLDLPQTGKNDFCPMTSWGNDKLRLWNSRCGHCRRISILW